MGNLNFRSQFLIYFLFALSVLAFLHPVSSNAQNIEDAIKSYQSGDYNTAKTLLDEQLAQDTENTLVLYNLGLTEYKLGNPGKALGYWRKAQRLSPQFNSNLQALVYAESQARLLKPEDVGLFNTLLEWITRNIPTVLIYCLSLLFLFLVIQKFIKFFVTKRTALLNDSAPPLFPSTVFVYMALFILCVLPLVHSYQYNLYPRATVITKNFEARSGPSEENASLFSLNEGDEVILLDKSEDWYKIKDKLGRLGWAANQNLFATTVTHD